MTIDPAGWTVSARRVICPAPRGVAYQAAGDLVHVACAGGELVSLPAAGGAATRTLRLERDLRDVVVDGVQLLVSRFRSAELLVVSPAGLVTEQLVPPDFSAPEVQLGGAFTASTAWRTLPAPGGGAIMVHQRGTVSGVEPQPGGYGSFFGGCDGIVHAAVTVLQPGVAPVVTPAISGLVLPIDLALSPDGTQVAVLSAGNAHTAGLSTLTIAPLVELTATQPDCYQNGQLGQAIGEPIALAFDSIGRVLVQSREPATLQILGAETFTLIALSTESRADTGHAVFHSNAGGNIACASCHNEGGEDGRVWLFDDIGPRRTQSVRGGILGTEPFHWDGDEANLGQLVNDVFVGRMSGPPLASDQLAALSHYVDTLPDLPQSAPLDAAAVDRGRALFEDAVNVGCVSCHAGAKFTNQATVSVGTGGAFQVPALHGVAWRAPFLHDGCAQTLTDRFGSCGGGDQHGLTSHLSAAQIADLVAYLESI